MKKAFSALVIWQNGSPLPFGQLGGGLCAVLLKNRFSLQPAPGVLPLWLTPMLGGLLVCFIYRWDNKAAGLAQTTIYMLLMSSVAILK